MSSVRMECKAQDRTAYPGERSRLAPRQAGLTFCDHASPGDGRSPHGAYRETVRSATRAGDRDDIRRGEGRLGVRRGGGSREENRCLRETGRDGGATRGVGLHEEEIGGDPREIGLPAVEG